MKWGHTPFRCCLLRLFVAYHRSPHCGEITQQFAYPMPAEASGLACNKGGGDPLPPLRFSHALARHYYLRSTQ